MKIQKFREYLILEGNSPEEYMANLLNQIKAKLDPIFDPNKVRTLKDFKNSNLELLDTPEVDKFPITARNFVTEVANYCELPNQLLGSKVSPASLQQARQNMHLKSRYNFCERLLRYKKNNL